MRQAGDAGADEVVEQAFSGGSGKTFYSYLSLSREEVKKHPENPVVQYFLLKNTPVPTWYNRETLLSGQQFFRKYALDIMTLLGAMSLPYCYAATPGNKAILFTGKMRKSPGKRLLDTAHFIIEVMKEGSLDENGEGRFEIQKTRLIHALVRYSIRTKGTWDSTWGVPVNQEDMAGTNIAFSYITLVGLDQSKYIISETEKEHFLYAWRLIGYFLNIDEGLLPRTTTEAKELELAIRKRHFRKSEEGVELTHDLINHYRESFPAVAGYFVESQIRYFVGEEVANILGLKSDPFKDSLVKSINKVREGINKRFVNPNSYKTMLRNHEILKARFT